jgi:multiple sugar transport system substrate-binding protein
MDMLLAEFAKQYPHIHVQPLELPSGSYTMALKDYMESGILDAVMISNNIYQNFVENGCTDLFEPLEQNENAHPILTELFRQNDDALVRPFIYSPVVLCYNKKHFEQSGVPVPDSSWTWGDLFRYGQLLAVPNKRFGFYFHLPSRNRWPIFMLQSGAVFHKDRNGNYQVKGSRIVECLESCRKLLAMTDVIPKMVLDSDADAEALFLDEKVSIIMTTYFFLNQLKDSRIAFDISPLPGMHDTSTLLIVNGLAVNSRSDNKEAAKLLVDYLTSYETQLLIRRNTLNIAAHRRAMQWEGEETVYRPSRFNLYMEIFPTFRLINEMGLSNYQLKAIKRDVMLFLSGLQDVEALTNNMEQILSEANQNNTAIAD